MSAKEMFEELGYKYYEDDGFTCYHQAINIPDKLNTEYIKFKKISFNRLSREMSIYNYKKDALCQKFIEDVTDAKINYLSAKELKAINQQCKELGWNK
ncbi:MAG: hypothetical protein ACI31R_05565 [Bacilli bacterium]